MKKKLSIVWDLTTICPFRCPICCMDAKASYDSTSKDLDYNQKLSLVDQIHDLAEAYEIKADLSGGEIMTDLRNLDIAEKLSSIITRDKLGISTSGYGITDEIAHRLSSITSEVELTMDTPPGVPYRLRPLEYAQTAALAVPLLKKYNLHTGIQTVLTKSNSSLHNLTALYDWLCTNQVDEWSLLRFYPSGRGAQFPQESLTDEELAKIVEMLQVMNYKNTSLTKPTLHFHYTMMGHADHTTECRCVKKSIGIFPNGDVTACFWATDLETQITEDRFYLGNVVTETLPDILKGPRARYWQDQPHICPLISSRKEESYVPNPKHYNRIA